MSYPILVERYTGAQAMTIVCRHCHAEEVIGPDDIVNDDLYACPRWAEGCEGVAQHKYLEADHKCGGCGQLGFFSADLGNCCSRRCQLQAEYAETLGGAR